MSTKHSSIEIYYLPVRDQGYDPDLETAISILNSNEIQRLDTFRVKGARESFLQARRMLRTLLADKTGQSPKAVEFSFSENGKPLLNNFPDIHFSLSHCKAAVVVAIANNNLGVDAEEINRGEKLWENTREFIGDYAANAVNLQKSEEHAADMFTLYWTAMEALVKLNDSSIYKERTGLNIGSELPKKPLFHYKIDNNHIWSLRFSQEFRLSLACHSQANLHLFRWVKPGLYHDDSRLII